MSNNMYPNVGAHDTIEMGPKADDLAQRPPNDARKRLLSDQSNNEPPKPKADKKAEPLPAMFAGASEVVYDDEDWQSDNEDDDDKENGDDDYGGMMAKRVKEKNKMLTEMKKMNILARVIFGIQGAVSFVNNTFQRLTKGYFWNVLFLLAYFVYFIFAMMYSFGDEPSWRLLVCTLIGLIVVTRHHVAKLAKMVFVCVNGSEHLSPRNDRLWGWFKFVFQWTMNIALLAFMVYVVIDVGIKDIENLRSLPGLFCFLLVCLLFSTNPGNIDWYVIYWSMGLQFLLAYFALRGEWGKDGVLWVQERLDEFFRNSEEGSKLIFGDSYKDHYMIFAALPLVFMMNATLVLLYYLGAMQLFTKFLGGCLNRVLHTSPVECISVAGGVFLEGGIMILTLRPFLGSLSKSEMFVVVTSGLASLGGTYVAILAGFQVSLEYIIPAMLVSAPATFAVCKLMVPENLESKRKDKGGNINWDSNEERDRYSNALDAVQGGAVSILGLLGNVIAVAFVFFSYISWINHTLEWFGERVGIERLSIELIFSYLLYPVSMAMGVAFEDCRRVAMLLGYRIGSTNIIAFFKLREMKLNKVAYIQYMEATNFTGPISHYRDDITLELWNRTLTSGFLTDRSEAIVTYCLCGFSSALSVGIIMSFIVVLVPKRRKWLTKMTFAAVVAGNIANCMTGCFASIFY